MMKLMLEEFDSLNLFGFNITNAAASSSKKKNATAVKNDFVDEKKSIDELSFVAPNSEDGSSVVLASGTHQIAYHDFGQLQNTQSDISRIRKYREIANYPEIDQAIEEVVNEMISMNDNARFIEVSIDQNNETEATNNKKISEKVIKAVKDEFENILSLLQFKTDAIDICRKWYIDGRLVYHAILDEKKTEIIELRPIDPVNIKKIKEVQEDTDPTTGAKLYRTVNEYFVYTEVDGTGTNTRKTVTKIAKDSIIYVPSGLLDEQRKNVISYLHKAIKVANQLRMLEDSMVIYRMVRAPERRVFRVDVGNLPAKKAEAYLQNVISKYRNKISYDSASGELIDKRQQLAMIEDFWLPSRNGGGTNIDTLPGGQAMATDDIAYFQRKMFRSLNVPLNRLEQEAQFSMGRSSEITRDEVRFAKFVAKLRAKFSSLFYQTLKINLVLKKIITLEEWDELKDNIYIDFIKDNYFSELKESELIRERLGTLREIEEFSGKYFSKKWIQKKILQMSDDEIEELDKEIEDEEKKGINLPGGEGDDNDDFGGSFG